MRILFIIPSYQPAVVYGGTTVVVSLLAEELVKLNHEVCVYTTTANGKVELSEIQPNETTSINGVSVTYFKRITGDHTHLSPAMLKKLFKTAKDFDVIHLHSWWNLFNISATALLAFLNKSYIISAHGMLSSYTLQNQNTKLKQLLHSVIGKLLLKKSIMHACTPQEFQEGLKIIPNWKGFTIHNLITLPENKLTTSQQNSVFSFAFLSRVEQKKGLDLLFNALPKLSFEYELKIAGNGEADYVSFLKDKAKLAGISEKISWIGWLNKEKFDFLEKADVFVLPSYNENFAVVVLEAISSGTPVLISNKVGLSDFVAQNNLGWVYDGSLTDLMLKLNTVHTDTETKEYVRENGYKIVSQNFNSEKLALEYIKEYKNLI